MGFKIGWEDTAGMVEIRVPNSLRTIQIFTVGQDILALERCQEIDAGVGIGSSGGYCHTYWGFAIDKDRPPGAATFSVWLATGV